MGISKHLDRSWGKRAAALAVITGAAFYGIASGSEAQAGPSTAGMTVTAVAPHHVAALTKNQVITVTGTNFDEDVITGVSVAGCTNDPMYIVQSSTTLLLKTDNSCAVGDLDAITITDASGTTATTPVASGKTELDFVAAPTILTADATHRPMFADNSAGADWANQAHSGSTTGGTVVRIYAGSGTKFVTSTAYPLAASLDGVAMTKVTPVGTANGNYLTGILGPHAADASPTLKITNNGVTKSFSFGTGGASATDQTHDFAYSGVTITAAPSSGPVMGGGTLTITGSGFSSSTTVTVGGNACTSPVATATKLTCTIPAASSQAAGPVKIVTASPASVLSAGSIYTYLDA